MSNQLRLYKMLAASLAAILLLGTAFYLYERHLGQPVAIEVNGKPVATVRNTAAANQILTAAMVAKVGTAYSGNDPVRLQTIRLRHDPKMFLNGLSLMAVRGVNILADLKLLNVI